MLRPCWQNKTLQTFCSVESGCGVMLQETTTATHCHAVDAAVRVDARRFTSPHTKPISTALYHTASKAGWFPCPSTTFSSNTAACSPKSVRHSLSPSPSLVFVMTMKDERIFESMSRRRRNGDERRPTTKRSMQRRSDNDDGERRREGDDTSDDANATDDDDDDDVALLRCYVVRRSCCFGVLTWCCVALHCSFMSLSLLSWTKCSVLLCDVVLLRRVAAVEWTSRTVALITLLCGAVLCC